MSYRTIYNLTVLHGASRDEIMAAVFEHVGYGPTSESCKRYDYEQDLIAVSRLYPTAVIMLRGQGEDAEDEWVLYVRDGEVVRHSRAPWEPPGPPPEWRE